MRRAKCSFVFLLVIYVIARAISAAEPKEKPGWQKVFEMARATRITAIETHRNTVRVAIKELQNELKVNGFEVSMVLRGDEGAFKRKVEGIRVQNCSAHDALVQFALLIRQPLTYGDFAIEFGSDRKNAMLVHLKLNGSFSMKDANQDHICKFGPVPQLAVNASGTDVDILAEPVSANAAVELLKRAGVVLEYTLSSVKWPLEESKMPPSSYVRDEPKAGE